MGYAAAGQYASENLISGQLRYNIYKNVADNQVINPLTGEVMADAGETVSYDKACEIEQAGVYEAFVTVEAKEYYTDERGETSIRMVEKTVKIIGNGMVDILMQSLHDLIFKALSGHRKIFMDPDAFLLGLNPVT